MGSELSRAKARAASAWTDAVQASYSHMPQHLGADYLLKEWSRSVQEMYETQWLTEPRHEDAGWDWPQIAARHRGVKDKTIALVSDGRLCALAQITVANARVLVRFLEGNPLPNCHMKGVRALLLLDLAATYGQRLGRKELHLQPVNDGLAELYRVKFGFVDGRDGSGKPVLKRDLQ